MAKRRGRTAVEKRDLEQWFFRITETDPFASAKWFEVNQRRASLAQRSLHLTNLSLHEAPKLLVLS